MSDLSDVERLDELHNDIEQRFEALRNRLRALERRVEEQSNDLEYSLNRVKDAVAALERKARSY